VVLQTLEFTTMKFLRILCLLALPVGICAQSIRESDADPRMLTAMLTGDALWETPTEKFEQQFQDLGLQWLSAGKDQARFFGNYAIFNPQLKTPEVIAEFQAGKLARVNVSIFNRGDSARQASDKNHFEQQVEAIKATISSTLGVQATERGKDKQSAVNAVGWMWMKPPTAYLLEYSFIKEVKSRDQEFRAEFIRLRAMPIAKQQVPPGTHPTNGANQPVARSSLAANLTHDANGDVVIKNVPMVDQGPKGYCAVATTERIFRYYGLAVDQHELAQIANTSDGGGTSPTAMLAALEKIEGRMKVRVRALQKFEMKEFLSLVADYNREAKRNGETKIDIDQGGTIDIAEIYSGMDPATLKTCRTVKDKSGYGTFQRLVTETINKGVPVMWSVQLGLFKEGNLPQSGGGHMRLIIGYNLKTSEIIYSDSWGAEHALKRMPMADARSMTTGMYYIEPRK
jgi:hypothetical protein